MDTKYIGNGGDFTEYEQWYTYITGLGALTEDVECFLTDDRDYLVTDATSGDFTALDFGAYQMHITSLPAVFHGGVWDKGPTLAGTSGGLIHLKSPNSPDQFFVTDLAFYNRRTIGDGNGASHLGNITISRCLSSIITSGANTNFAFHHLTTYGQCKMDTCAARAVGASTGCRGLFLQPYNNLVAPEVRGFTAIGFGYGVAVYGNKPPKVVKNAVAYNSVTAGFYTTNPANGWGDASNNASDDGTHPGTDGVLITADPFEADGYTPSQAGELTAAGIDVGIILGADGKPFAPIPAIGAYPAYRADDVAPILTNPTSEGNFPGLLCKVDTDEDNGGIYCVSTDTATKPEPEQVEAGQDHLGATANDSQFGAVTTTGSQSLLLDSVVGDTTQHVHFMHKDEAGNYSLVVTAAAIVVPDYSITFNLTDDLIDGDVLSNIQGNTLINGHNLIITGSIENITSLYKLTIYLTGTNSIGTVINPGTGYGQVNILYPVPITVTVTDSDTKLPIELAAVQLYLTSDYSTEVISGLTDTTGVVTTTYNYLPSVGDVGVEGWVRQMDLLNDDYTPKDISGEITENGLAIAVSLTKI